MLTGSFTPGPEAMSENAIFFQLTVCPESQHSSYTAIGVVGIVPRDGCELLSADKGAYMNF
jgi:hypothetical protein